jgi:hypothetical protein
MRQGRFVIVPTTEKVVRKELNGGIPLPKYLSKLMIRFQKKVRPCLNPKTGVIAMWITITGRPLEVEVFRRSIRNTVSEIIGDDFRNVTCAAFRRIMATFVFDDKVKLDGESLKDFRDKYAGLINTGTDVLEKHYIRNQTLAQQESVIDAVEKEILDTPQSRLLKRKIVEEKRRVTKRQKQEEHEESEEDEESDDQEENDDDSDDENDANDANEELEEMFEELTKAKAEIKRLKDILDHHRMKY